MKQIFLFVLLVSTLVSSGQKQSNIFIIGSGSRGGNYYKTGNYIASQYNYYFNKDSKTDYTFQNIETNGSIDNINLLKDNKIDFAIVQRNILINNYFNEGKGTKNIQIIAPLFQEKLNIYYNGKTDAEIKTLDLIAAKKKGLKIGFTSLNGYSHKIFRTIIQYLNIENKDIKEIEGNYSKLIEDFKNRKIDIIVSFSLPLQEIDTMKTTHRFYLSPGNVNLIASRIKNIKKTKLKDNEYTLGIWSFLIGSNSAMFQIKNKKLLIDALLNENLLLNDDYIHNIIVNSYSNFIKNQNKEASLLQNLPLTNNLKAKIGFKSIDWHLYGLILFFITLIILFIYLYKGNIFRRFSLKYFWNRYKHFQFGFLLLIIIYFSSIEILLFAEKSFYHNTGIKSQILNLTYKNLHSWLAVTTLTGNDNGIFPLSLPGKFMVALNTLNFWIGTILVGASEYVNYQLRKKRKEGIMETKHKNHVVIFGWDNSTEKFVTELIRDAKEFYDMHLDIVLVVEKIKPILDKYLRIKELHEQKIIDIIQGDAMDFHVLELAKVHLARVVILLGERNNEHSDKNTVMRAFAISRFCKNKKKENNKNNEVPIKKIKEAVTKPFKNKNKENFAKHNISADADTVYMIAELNNNYYKESLIEADVNEILVAGNYRKAAMKQSVFSFGMTKVLDELMQYNEGNDFYKIDLAKKENKFLVGKTYDELLFMLRKVGILLVGIHVIFHDNDDKGSRIIIDQKIIRKKLASEENGLTRDIIINPTDEKERTRKVDGDDHLIVIATSMKVIKEGLKKLREEIKN